MQPNNRPRTILTGDAWGPLARQTGRQGERNDNDGTVQVINGAAGNNEGLQSGKGVGGLIVSANYKDHGFGSIEVIGDRLRWRYWLSETGDVYDEFFLESRRTK